MKIARVVMALLVILAAAAEVAGQKKRKTITLQSMERIESEEAKAEPYYRLYDGFVRTFWREMDELEKDPSFRIAHSWIIRVGVSDTSDEHKGACWQVLVGPDSGGPDADHWHVAYHKIVSGRDLRGSALVKSMAKEAVRGVRREIDIQPPAAKERSVDPRIIAYKGRLPREWPATLLHFVLK